MEKKYYIYKMNLSFLSTVSVILLITLLVLTMWLFSYHFTRFDYLIATFLALPWIFLHELLHGMTHLIHGAKRKNITYGIYLEKGILYCLCKQNISKKNCLLSLVAPLIWLGIVAYIIGILWDLPILVLLAIWNISGSIGDIFMFGMIIRLKNIGFSEFDDPTAFAIYTSENLEKRKWIGFDYIGNKTQLKRTQLQRFHTTKKSIILLIGIILLLFLCC